jgi:hypothetical protein
MVLKLIINCSDMLVSKNARNARLQYAGDKQRPHAMDWNHFPLDMQEEILRCLPLVDLARVATTCRSFHTFSCWRVAELQKARCDLAKPWMERKRIMGIIDLVNGLFRGDCITPTRRIARGRISADGVFEVNDQASEICQKRQILGQAAATAVEIPVRIYSWPSEHRLTAMAVFVLGPNNSSVAFCVQRSMKSVYITMTPSDINDLSGLAFVQTLLTCGFGRKMNGASPFKGHIIWSCLSEMANLKGVPWANPRLLAQIAPLLPLLHKAQFGLIMDQGSERFCGR